VLPRFFGCSSREAREVVAAIAPSEEPPLRDQVSRVVPSVRSARQQLKPLAAAAPTAESRLAPSPAAVAAALALAAPVDCQSVRARCNRKHGWRLDRRHRQRFSDSNEAQFRVRGAWSTIESADGPERSPAWPGPVATQAVALASRTRLPIAPGSLPDLPLATPLLVPLVPVVAAAVSSVMATVLLALCWRGCWIGSRCSWW
jgi:hypothetical protein